ncbi:MAG TPA: hypothetical protein VIT43_08435 [Candidatus Dormibacteraeota bacterium]
MPLSTLAVPEISTGELTALLPSGLSMMMRRLFGIGVADVAGSEEGDDALGLVDVAPLALGEADAVDVPCSTNVVVLSPPHAASNNMQTASSPNPIRFTRPSTLMNTPADRR